MTRQSFDFKWYSISSSDTADVLMRIASNLSDIQARGVDETTHDHLNRLKEFIFDYRSVIRQEQREGVSVL